MGNLPDRIKSKIKLTGTCWMWNGALSGDGYSRIAVTKAGKRSTPSVHKLLYELLVKTVPHNMELDHICRTRRCVNPAHLEPVTHAENLRRSPYSRNRKPKKQCPNGHPMNALNTTLVKTAYGGNSRECKECKRVTVYKSWYKKEHGKIPETVPPRRHLSTPKRTLLPKVS